MDDHTVVLALVLVLLTACIAGLLYLAWPALVCTAVFITALVADWWRARKGRHRRHAAPCARRPRQAPSWARTDAAWQRDLELTR